MRTFVIGDVHGHTDRLIALLKKIGYIEEDGEAYDHLLTPAARDIEVIQVGDLLNVDDKSYLVDLECVNLVRDFDIRLCWGNHERAMYDYIEHRFRGFVFPSPEVMEGYKDLNPRLGYVREGHLITHAGLHSKYVKLYLKKNPAASFLPVEQLLDDMLSSETIEPTGMTNDVSQYRMGHSDTGGILWRDSREKLWTGIPQVFGHTRGDCIRKYGDSYCIDIGNYDDGMLAGIWLDNHEVVAVGPNAVKVEKLARGLL